MIRKGFKMKIRNDQGIEYEKRHDDLWDSMKDIIHEHGGSNYTIFLDKDTNVLYGYIEIESEEKWASISQTKECKKWWGFMSDIMETNPDNSPVSFDLKEVFHLE